MHLGFDLASLQHAPVTASNRGVVLFANYLGIYGNCVILDHGLGVQSLYAHLSTIDVKEGERSRKARRSAAPASTGLAGGDHLHFTMLVNGVAGEPGRMVGSALDGGPRVPQDSRGRRPGADAAIPAGLKPSSRSAGDREPVRAPPPIIEMCETRAVVSSSLSPLRPVPPRRQRQHRRVDGPLRSGDGRYGHGSGHRRGHALPPPA